MAKAKKTENAENADDGKSEDLIKVEKIAAKAMEREAKAVAKALQDKIDKVAVKISPELLDDSAGEDNGVEWILSNGSLELTIDLAKTPYLATGKGSAGNSIHMVRANAKLPLGIGGKMIRIDIGGSCSVKAYPREDRDIIERVCLEGRTYAEAKNGLGGVSLLDD